MGLRSLKRIFFLQRSLQRFIDNAQHLLHISSLNYIKKFPSIKVGDVRGATWYCYSSLLDHFMFFPLSYNFQDVFYTALGVY